MGRLVIESDPLQHSSRELPPQISSFNVSSKQVVGHSSGSKFLDIFTQHRRNEMTMLLDMSYNQAYE